MQTNYLFYDLETSGLNKAFDQVQQFAGKTLNFDFTQQQEHYFEARLSPDIIPSAHAMLTHRISLVDDATRVSEYEVISAIHKLINQPGTISLGYNTMGFDDSFLRFSFHRNLYAPYTHQYANGCMRMDVFPMVAFYYLYDNDIMQWPTINEKLSLKLEALADCNGWSSGRAHHAMNDVDATIALARHLYTKNKKMWDYLQGFFHKQIDQHRTAKLDDITVHEQKHKLGLLVDAKMGVANNFCAPFVMLGGNKMYKNVNFWLRLDKPLPEDVSLQSLMSKGYILQKKYAEPGFILPYQERFIHKLSPERVANTKENISHIQNNMKMWSALIEALFLWEHAKTEKVDTDAILYNMGFRSHNENNWCSHWHTLIESEQITALEQLPDGILKRQAIRLLGRKNPNINDEAVQQCLAEQLQSLASPESSIYDYKGDKKYSIAKAHEDIRSLKATDLDNEQKDLLAELEAYLKAKTIEYV